MKGTKVPNLAAVSKLFVNAMILKVHNETRCGQVLMDHMMHITNCCLMTQHFYSIKGKKALSFTGYFAL